MPEIDVAERQRWQEAVGNVMDAVRAWARAAKWDVTEETVERSEERLGTYAVPVLTVYSEAGRLIIEPVARWTSPGEGRIDVYSWPSMNRLLLTRLEGDWELMLENGVRWPNPWSRETFLDLAKALNVAA
jgi:hypothetical protein